MRIQKQMSEELKNKEIFEQARSYAFEYINGIEEMDVFPSELNLENMNVFDEILPIESVSAKKIRY